MNLSITFPAKSNNCYVWKDWNTILVMKHKDGLYHAKVTLSDQKEAAHATVDINLLHCQMGHISINQIQSMVNSGQLRGIDTLSGTPVFCEACTLEVPQYGRRVMGMLRGHPICLCKGSGSVSTTAAEVTYR